MLESGTSKLLASTGVVHHSRRHAAVRTREYVFSQLIPYIGNKRKLLHLIEMGLRTTGLAGGTFVDLFTGSTVVARYAKKRGHRVVANDWEPYAHETARGTVVLNRPPAFRRLGGVEGVFARLNNLPPVRGYVATHLCPVDDECPDVRRERMFFTQENGRRIDAIREQVAQWEADGVIGPDERAYILAALIYAVSYASNTSGVFKGFHNGWGGKTGTALYRIRRPLMLDPPVLHDNGQQQLAFCEDGQALAGVLAERLGRPADVVYIDPPYNQHPYGSNYHVLTTVALWDKPAVNPSIWVNGRTVDKSAIRKDWRRERRSAYNTAREALPALGALVGRIEARWILMSYSTDGNMPLEGVLETLAARGALRVFAQRYKRYRVSTPRMSPKPYNVEFVAVVDTARRATRRRVERIAAALTAAEAWDGVGACRPFACE